MSTTLPTSAYTEPTVKEGRLVNATPADKERIDAHNKGVRARADGTPESENPFKPYGPVKPEQLPELARIWLAARNGDSSEVANVDEIPELKTLHDKIDAVD